MDFEKPVVELEDKLEQLKSLKAAGTGEIAHDIAELENQLERLKELIYKDLTAWQRVQIARHPQRPRVLDYINHIFSDFTELHGDRLYHDDPAIVGGLAHLEGDTFVVIGTQKGKNAKTNIKRNFGMPMPEGYRKALRLMKIAKKFNLPIITFIDTQGAYPGIGAEERGQAVAIAENLQFMSRLAVPIIAVNVGEGGSGGALAISVADRLIMLENSYYSVITPEGCASILWHDETKACDAAEALKITAEDLAKMKIADIIVKEPLGGAHRDVEKTYYILRKKLIDCYKELKTTCPNKKKLIEDREKKLNSIGRLTSV